MEIGNRDEERGQQGVLDNDLADLGVPFSADVVDNYAEAVRIRRDLHQHPELGGGEKRTTEIVRETLKSIGVKSVDAARTGVVGLIEGEKPGKVLLLRADMDALPVFEETDLPYKSKTDGVMHACGHDAHTAMLLVLAKIIQKRGLKKGTVKLMFQPAEEGGDGAAEMIREGVLDNPKVDAALAFHVWTPYALGEIVSLSGAQAASVDGFRLTVYGKGAHGARPEEGIDPILIASQLVTAAQSIVTRRIRAVDPAVLSITAMNGGCAFNIIPEKVELLGTFRAFDEKVRREIRESLVCLARSLAEFHGGRIEYETLVTNAPVINDAALARRLQALFQDLVGKPRRREPKPLMVGEDFGEIVQRVPGALVLLGAGNPEIGADFAHHHPRFKIDERVMAIGLELGLRTVEMVLQD